MHRGLLVVTLVACQPVENEIRQLYPEVAVLPDAVDFGGVIAETESAIPVFVTNAGQAPLEVSLRLEGGGEAYAIDSDGWTVAPDENNAVFVAFTPPTYLPYDATLVVLSNDEERPRVEVPITGFGEYAPSPELCVSPAALDFGTVPAGSMATGIVFIENCGDAPFSLGEMVQTGSGAFSVEPGTDPSQATVDGGDTQPVVVYYAPQSEVGDFGTLEFTTDIDSVTTQVLLLGNDGGTDFEYPEAVIDCPGTTAPPETISLDGSGSFDPSGLEPLEFEWTLLDQPQGSASGLSEFILPTTSLYTDIAGRYEVQLQVTNTAGVLSAPTKCVLDAIPEDRLHIELTWDTTGVDLDLHLLDNPADIFNDFYVTPGDCSWCNANPGWGSAGTDDNPRLDLDDRSDGPENINIPEPADGSYAVVVHYYDPVGGPATTATVNVYIDGIEMFSGSKVLQRDEVWEVGQVNWSGMGSSTFGVFSTPLYTAPARNCR